MCNTFVVVGVSDTDGADLRNVRRKKTRYDVVGREGGVYTRVYEKNAFSVPFVTAFPFPFAVQPRVVLRDGKSGGGRTDGFFFRRSCATRGKIPFTRARSVRESPFYFRNREPFSTVFRGRCFLFKNRRAANSSSPIYLRRPFSP